MTHSILNKDSFCPQSGDFRRNPGFRGTQSYFVGGEFKMRIRIDSVCGVL